MTWNYADTSFALTKTKQGTFDEVVSRAREELAKEGFGVLTEIDVKATLKKKLDKDVDDYVILGACNPTLAHQALTAEPAIGTLLPCNVVVAKTRDGIAVSAIDPVAQFSLVKKEGVEHIAADVRERLVRVVEAV